MHALAATIGSPHVALLSIRLMHAKKCPAACSNGRIRVEEFGMQDWFVTYLLSRLKGHAYLIVAIVITPSTRQELASALQLVSDDGTLYERSRDNVIHLASTQEGEETKKAKSENIREILIVYSMPYEEVQEKVVRTRQVRVCGRCRCELPDKKSAFNAIGGIGGSLGGSLGGSMILGSVLGPIGAIGGAIAGSIAGGRAGRDASRKVHDTLHADLCDACRRQISQDHGSTASISSYENQEDNKWGSGRRLGAGHKLGGGIDESNGEGSKARSYRDLLRGGEQPPQHQPETPKSAKEKISEMATSTTKEIQESMSIVGKDIQDGFAWMKASVSGRISGIGGAADASTSSTSSAKASKPSSDYTGRPTGSGRGGDNDTGDII